MAKARAKRAGFKHSFSAYLESLIEKDLESNSSSSPNIEARLLRKAQAAVHPIRGSGAKETPSARKSQPPAIVRRKVVKPSTDQAPDQSEEIS